MKITSRFRGVNMGSPGVSVNAATREADATSIQRVDEAGALPRPSGLTSLYTEEEYGALAAEQDHLWSAEGERQARPHHLRTRGSDVPAQAVRFLLGESEKAVRAAYEDYFHAVRVLGPYVRREPWAKLRYALVWPILALGDASGVLSAAIALGDVPWVAAGQALSAGLAGACSGLVGAEIRHAQSARMRRREAKQLTADQRRFERLFATADHGLGVVKLVGLVSIAIAALLTVAVFALRSPVEGSAAGLAFAFLMSATALGSAVLGYYAADEVADLLHTYAKRVARIEKHHRTLAKDKALRVHTTAEAAARSLQAEYQLRGQAADNRIESLAFRILRRNPQVAGHGYPAGEPTGIVGRRPRRKGGAA
ncbi:MAG TPA: hypothetical protein VFU43_04060 [Streptosporangiaceae bacterium]|nr:hypothetical protein [Streptosporangiaceae bacterium]